MNRERTHRGERERMADRRNKALELRKTGMRYVDIAEKLGVSMQTAHKDVATALADLRKYGLNLAVEMRQMELERLEASLLKVNQAMAEARKQKDQELILKCVDRQIKISESKRKLLGLDMPQRIDVTSGGEQLQKRIEIVDTVTGSVIHDAQQQADQDDDGDD